MVRGDEVRYPEDGESMDEVTLEREVEFLDRQLARGKRRIGDLQGMIFEQ